ncbi:hypothetical protein [Streptomyces sp. NPDC057623]|uniref:hypothetical protein n=1 Tax=Streptomyces sp. NPDC057623 TaxID=3346187 RepID=UPI0036A9DC45
MADNGAGGPSGTRAFERRLLLLVDAKRYGAADALTQHQFQEAIQRLLEEAADAAGLHWERWQTQQGGDSLFAALPKGASEPALVDPFMRTLDAGLRSFNHGRERAAWLRLRAAAHFGSASPGPNGFVGPAPVELGRICDSVALRAALTAAPDACLAVGISAGIFNDVVREAYTTLRADEFREVLIEEKEHRGRAWIRVPGADVWQLDLAGCAAAGPGRAASAPADRQGPKPSPPAPREATVIHHFHGPVHADGAHFGISN